MFIGLATASYGQTTVILGMLMKPTGEASGFYNGTANKIFDLAPGIINGQTNNFNDYPQSGGAVQAVARAEISDVLAAAKRGTVCTWMKYANGAWDQDGLTGAGSNVFPWHSHADATYCRPYGMYVRTGWSGGSLYLLSSTDGVDWGDQKVLYSARGEVPYSFFAGFDGGSDDCSEVGDAFSIYFPNRVTGKVYRIPVTVQGGAARPADRGGLESEVESGDGWLCRPAAGRGGSGGRQAEAINQFGSVNGGEIRLVPGPPDEALACEGRFWGTSTNDHKVVHPLMTSPRSVINRRRVKNQEPNYLVYEPKPDCS